MVEESRTKEAGERKPAARRLAGEDVRAGVERALDVNVMNEHGRLREPDLN